MHRSLLFIFFWSCLSSLIAQPLTSADQMPYFPGCDRFENGSDKKRNCSNQSLVNFISNHLLYPEAAQSKQVEGTVYVSFVISAVGKVENTLVLRDIGSGCGEAALQVLQQMPTWEAGVHEGQRVPIKLNLPIQFSFSPGSEEEQDVPYKIHWGMLKKNQISREQLRGNSAVPVQVRDLFGNEVLISELLFVYEKKGTYKDAKSNGRMNPQMTKVIQRAKRGGLFSVVATVQKEGQFINVERQFEIID